MAPYKVELSTEVMAKIHTNGEFTLFLHLHGRKMERHQLGAAVHRFLNLDGRVEVSEEGYCRYSAKFSSQRDYDRAIQRSSWWISNHCSIDVYRWQPNIQFGEVPLFVVGDMVEVRVDRLPVEYRINDVVTKVAEAICALFGCDVSMIDTSIGKPPRFWCRSARNCSLELPAYVQIADGPLVGLTYSRAHAYDSPQARRCYHCGRFGHIRRTCPELSQWTRRCPNRANPSNSGPTQVHRPPLDREPVPISEEMEGGVEAHESGSLTSSEERHEGAIGNTQFSLAEWVDRSSGSISPSRPAEQTEMSPNGAIIVENGRDSKTRLYNTRKEVSGIHVVLKVTNDQRGNQRQATITPHTGHAPSHCSKRILYLSIDSADIWGTIRILKDTCDGSDVSIAIVLDKSSVLFNDDRIVQCLGFSASHCVKITFRSFGSDGTAIDVKGNCLLMWKKEEVSLNVSPELYGNTELLTQNLEFNASWVVHDSRSGEEDESPHGFSSSGEEEGSSDSFVSSSSDESSVLPSNGDESSDSEGTTFFSIVGEEISDESLSTLSPIGVALADSEEYSLFTTSGERRSNDSSSSSGANNESSFAPSNGDANSEASSLFSTDTEELSNRFSAPSSSDESLFLIFEIDWD